uniref:Uncharacterized protein n=1 Tax=Pyrococcus abyssi (strain GE5 / Orsay) TaxID=272844 RepID=G8ZFI4_PYRAB|nr:TPA: hypothetical protein PAB0004.1n [Pyrococcus abyssi GE5]
MLLEHKISFSLKPKLFIDEDDLQYIQRNWDVCNVENVDIIRELAKIERKLDNIEKLLNELLEREESYAIMKLSEESLREFLADEPYITPKRISR